MTKLIIILLIIFFGIVIGLKMIKNYIKKTLKGALGNISGNETQSARTDTKKNIIYEKNDIVVLKGEAKDKNEK